MAQTKTHIDPLSTRNMLRSLGYAIDEIKLVRSIHKLNEQSKLYTGEQIDPRRQRYLADEIRTLSNRLEAIREKARSVDSGL